jgi:ATPase family AAA domain-containing protein 3A/B
MFGGGRKNDKDNKKENSLSSVMAPEGPKKGGSGSSSITGFDPEGLERAAKAARDLDSSKNAGSAIELIKTQELTKQVR